MFRYYASDLGRFTQQDSIGLAGGINLYAYVPNPLTWGIRGVGVVELQGLLVGKDLIHRKETTILMVWFIRI
ncbi:TPA: hypothetical protein OTT33_002600 [Proteus mirabilis]|nr:hypothetical protein [Proteus mirabilis]